MVGSYPPRNMSPLLVSLDSLEGAPQKPMNVTGRNGQIHFDGQYVTITRAGFVARVTIGKGEKRLHIGQISAIQWKPPGWGMNGFIQFSLPGGNEVRSHFGGQTRSAGQDENTVMFTKQQQPAFDKLREAIDAAIARHHARPEPSRVPPVVAAQAPPLSIADELVKLAALKDQGVLSAQEFEQQKARLLGR